MKESVGVPIKRPQVPTASTAGLAGQLKPVLLAQVTRKLSGLNLWEAEGRRGWGSMGREGTELQLEGGRSGWKLHRGLGL